jgi:hypothetical protein
LHKPPHDDKKPRLAPDLGTCTPAVLRNLGLLTTSATVGDPF